MEESEKEEEEGLEEKGRAVERLVDARVVYDAGGGGGAVLAAFIPWDVRLSWAT